MAPPRGISSAEVGADGLQQPDEFQSPPPRGISSSPSQTNTSTVYAAVSTPSSSAHRFSRQQLDGKDTLLILEVSIPSSSGHLFSPLQPAPDPSGCAGVSIPSSSGHLFSRHGK